MQYLQYLDVVYYEERTAVSCFLTELHRLKTQSPAAMFIASANTKI